MTRAPRFLNPRKLGLSLESWLRHEVLFTECTAKVCLYFLGALYEGEAAFRDSSTGIEPRGTADGTSRLVVMAVSMTVAMFARQSTGLLRVNGKHKRQYATASKTCLLNCS